MEFLYTSSPAVIPIPAYMLSVPTQSRAKQSNLLVYQPVSLSWLFKMQVLLSLSLCIAVLFRHPGKEGIHIPVYSNYAKLSLRINSAYEKYTNIMHVVMEPAIDGLLCAEPVQHITTDKEAMGYVFLEYFRCKTLKL